MFKSYNELIEFAKSQNREKGKGIYLETHHIIPVSMGGTNDKDNLILLTLYEHIQAHYLLAIENEKINRKFYIANIQVAWLIINGKSIFSEEKRKEIEKLLKEPSNIIFYENLKILQSKCVPHRKNFDPYYKNKRIWVYFKNQIPVRILEKNKNSKTYSKYQIMNNCPICKNPNSEKSFACCEEHKQLYIQQIKEENSIRQKEVCKKYDLAGKMNEVNTHTGMLDKIWIKKDNESKVINKNELNDYLSQGWIEGRILEGHQATENQKLRLSERRRNTCYIYNDEVSAKEIKLEELDLYISCGWKKGRKPNSTKRASGYKQPKMAWIHKDNEFKKIREENLESYLKDGWKRGRKDN